MWHNHVAGSRRRVRPGRPHNTDVMSGVGGSEMRGHAMSWSNGPMVGELDRSDAHPGWRTLVDGAPTPGPDPRLPTVGRVVGRFVLANLIAVILLMAGSVWASEAAAKAEAIADARRGTDLLAMLLVEPALDERLAAGDPAGVAAMDDVLRPRLAAAGVLRVKIWSPDQRIVYSDAAALIGRQFRLEDEELDALHDGRTRAELSDLGRPENQFERSAGQLLEVHRQIRTPEGRPMLLEAYFSYRDATARQVDISLPFAAISVCVLLALLAMQLPLAHRMVTQLRAAGRERELLHARAVDASTEERRRIAGNLHDGIVQDVSASALLVAGAADQLRDEGTSGSSDSLAEDLAQASQALRASAGSLRSLLVEIYPPDLERTGLPSALGDLAARLRPRGVEARISIPDELDLPLATAGLLFRTAQEVLLNVAKHAGARTVDVTIREVPAGLVLEITDDGIGFDLDATLSRPRSGHLGFSVLADLAAAAGARLDVRTAPGKGTSLRLEVPRS
jgi:two-component system NarL family sensor kinase